MESRGNRAEAKWTIMAIRSKNDFLDVNFFVENNFHFRVASNAQLGLLVAPDLRVKIFFIILILLFN
jgi:hypothetical protein